LQLRHLFNLIFSNNTQSHDQMIHAKRKWAGKSPSPSVGLLFLTCLCSNFIIAQTFNGQGGLLIPPGAPTQTVGITTSIATVTGVGIIGNGCVTIENVTIDLTHTFVGDIAIFVIAPTGQVLELSSSNGGSGDNYINSVFKDNTALFITSGAPPYTGIWRPEGRQQSTTPPFPNGPPLGTFTFANTFNGLNADGNWTLLINDYVAVDVGVLNSWSITFSMGGGGVTVDLGPDITICPGQTVTLTPTVNPTPDTYAWSTGASSSTIMVNPVVTTSYNVTVTDNGCVDADTITVIVNPNAVTANAGPDVAICQGGSTTLTGSGGTSNATYQWSSGQSGQNISVSPTGTTTYTLTVTDSGCTSTDQVIVSVTLTPVADAGLPVTICEGESITLSASGGTQNNQYTWSTGQNGPNITVSPTSTTTYTVTVNINGCMDSDDVEVTVEPSPDVDAGLPVSICAGEDVTLTATGSGGTYQWSNGASGDEIIVSLM
jgi:subtilisin-like proprotein convertase family protein